MRAQRARCLRCGGNNCCTGKLTNVTPWLRYSVQFEPDEASGWALSRNAAVGGLACLDCGHLELVVDIERVRKLIGREETPRA